LWTGHILTPQEVTDQSGVARVYPLMKFQPFIDALMTGAGFEQSADAASADFGTFFTAMKQGAAKIAVLGGAVPVPLPNAGPGVNPPSAAIAGSPRAYAESMVRKYPGLTMANATPVVTTLRQVKTAYEQKLLRRSVEISAEAHIEGMKAAKPGRWEYEVEAAIEYWYLKNGAMSWGYPSIVGSGPNATTLHYEKSTRQMQNGDLLLVDAAANYQGLTGDITRTYPVNGKFTKEQREIYELVLAAQNAGISAAQLGKPVSDIPKAVRETFAAGLLKLGLITDAAQVSVWMPHGPTHGIGVDVHDPLGPTLVAGSAFTIEPGLYFREDSLSNTGRVGGVGRSGGANPLDAVRPVFERYKNIGVRIEDSFLMTESGVVNLSAKAPRSVADIEKVVGTGRE
jgi:Xaa-Pro aminopeptidase